MKRILFCIYQYPIAISLPILSAAELLADSGYHVDILSEKCIGQRPDITHPAIRMIYLDEKFCDCGPNTHDAPIISRYLNRSVTVTNPEGVILYLNTEQYMHWCLHHAAQCGDVVCSIGFEREGSFAAMTLCTELGIPFGIYSLEFFDLPQNASGYQLYQNEMEQQALTKASFLVIQGEIRFQHYRRIYRVPDIPVVMIPTSIRGAINRMKSNYLYKRFAIPRDKKILLHAGSITAWSCTSQIASIAATLPEEFVVVIHGYVRTRTYADEIMAFKAQAPNKVYLSDTFLPVQELDELVSSADIGLMFFSVPNETMRTNIENACLASNRMALYSKHRLPVIANDMQGVRALFDTYRCGLIVHDVQGIAAAAAAITSDYNVYIAAMERCFEEYYSFDRHAQKLLAQISALTKVGAHGNVN